MAKLLYTISHTYKDFKFKSHKFEKIVDINYSITFYQYNDGVESFEAIEKSMKQFLDPLNGCMFINDGDKLEPSWNTIIETAKRDRVVYMSKEPNLSSLAGLISYPLYKYHVSNTKLKLYLFMDSAKVTIKENNNSSSYFIKIK